MTYKTLHMQKLLIFGENTIWQADSVSDQPTCKYKQLLLLKQFKTDSWDIFKDYALYTTSSVDIVWKKMALITLTSVIFFITKVLKPQFRGICYYICPLYR
jgi:hypothetical protein